MAVELAEMIGQLRAELAMAMSEGEGADLRFELGPVDLELTVAVSKEGSASGKVRFWVVDTSADVKGSAMTTQKIKLQLDPRRTGRPGKPLISGEAVPGER
jgi:hypothetical protein